jgi:hypothetical protein
MEPQHRCNVQQGLIHRRNFWPGAKRRWCGRVGWWGIALIPLGRVSFSDVAISVYIAICAVISVIAAALMTDYTGKDIEATR